MTHQKLLDQLRLAFGDDQIPDNLQPLLQQISDTYQKYDDEKQQIEADVALKTEQLIGSTSRAYSFLDSLNMGLILCDINPEVVLINQPARRMLAAKFSAESDGELNLAAIDDMMKPEIELKSAIQQSLSANQPLEGAEINFGKSVLRIFIAPMVNEVSQGNKQQIGAVILVEDITEQKVAERSKDEFFSIASHELRTPLTAIRGNSSLIKKYYADSLTSKDMVEMIDDIHESAVRLINIVNDFLDVSAFEQGKISMKPEAFLLEEVVDDVTRDMKNLCETKGISLVDDQSISTAPPVMADKQRVKQVLYNLVGNAVKFTEKGNITISAQADDDFVNTIVADTGRGMSDENQRLLFRKFQQAGSSLLTRDTIKGTGLGLYISKLIVEQSGGKISLQSSQIDVGSSFTFSLPRDKSPS